PVPGGSPTWDLPGECRGMIPRIRSPRECPYSRAPVQNVEDGLAADWFRLPPFLQGFNETQVLKNLSEDIAKQVALFAQRFSS
ncbi:MAG: hypothetical protein ACC655_10070, partial [Rhodothermia bacterium]